MEELTLDEAINRLNELSIDLQTEPENLNLWDEFYAITEACKTVKPVREHPPVKIKI
jgi:hypothetical protein